MYNLSDLIIELVKLEVGETKEIGTLLVTRNAGIYKLCTDERTQEVYYCDKASAGYVIKGLLEEGKI